MASYKTELKNNGEESPIVSGEDMGRMVFNLFDYISKNENYSSKLNDSALYSILDGDSDKPQYKNCVRYNLNFEGKLKSMFLYAPNGLRDSQVKSDGHRWSKNTVRLKMGDGVERDVYVSTQWRGHDTQPNGFNKYIYDLEEFMIQYCNPNWRIYVDGIGSEKLNNNIVSVQSGKTTNIGENNQNIKLPMQKIYYGAPGTGKSYGIKKVVGVDGNGKMRTDNNIRVTFHPDSDYASFVGCYKPTMNYNDQIVYKFVPQAFAKAYVKAWKNYLAGNGENFYLVIEEINRGNCAQIFGDIFQLLDRNKDGFSEYGIVVDADLEKYLKDEFKEYLKDKIENGGLINYLQGVFEKYIEENKDKDDDLANYLQEVLDWYFREENIGGDSFDIKMYLPPTLSLLATMNTSDQSLFPMDSAFKRRWDWKYVPIKDEKKGWIIEGIKINDKELYWWDFLDTINKKIKDDTKSTDKQMGYYFVKPDNGNKISIERFVDKVLFYLWNDVFKRYGNNDDYNIVNFYKGSNIDSSEVNRVLGDLFVKTESKETGNATE